MIFRLISVGLLLSTMGCGVEHSDPTSGVQRKHPFEMDWYKYAKIPDHPWEPELEIEHSDRRVGIPDMPASFWDSHSDIFIYSYGKIPGREWKPESKIEEIKNPRWLHPYFVLAPSDDGA